MNNTYKALIKTNRKSEYIVILKSSNSKKAFYEVLKTNGYEVKSITKVEA